MVLIQMALKLFVILLLCGSTGSERPLSYNSVPEPLDFGFVPTGTYDTSADHDPGAIGLLFHIVQGFLYIVQPNAFPQGKYRLFTFLCYSLISGSFSVSLSLKM